MLSTLVFVNLRYFVNRLGKSINSKANDILGLGVNVLQIIGATPKLLKFSNIGIFTGRIHFPGNVSIELL